MCNGVSKHGVTIRGFEFYQFMGCLKDLRKEIVQTGDGFYARTGGPRWEMDSQWL